MVGSLHEEARGAQLERDSPTLATEKWLRELAEASEVVIVNTTRARRQFSDLVTRVGFTGQRVVLERNGKLLAAIVPLEVLAAVIAAEDRLDVAAARKALSREPGRSRPWSEVRKELGLEEPKGKKKTRRRAQKTTKKKTRERRRAVA